jgi:hypothetical protein
MREIKRYALRKVYYTHDERIDAMRNLFIVGAKLMGLYFLLTDLIALMHYSISALILSMNGNLSQLEAINQISIYIYMFAAPFVLHVAAGLLLLFRTNWLAKVLLIPDVPQPHVDARNVLQVGIILLGFYMMIVGIPGVLSYLMQLIQMNAQGGFSSIVRFDWNAILPNAVRIVMGTCLILTSQKLSTLIMRNTTIQHGEV